MAGVPRLRYPLQVDPATGHLAVVDQDSLDNIACRVEVALRTRVGDRGLAPEFGSPDLTFAELPLNLDALVSLLEAQAPGAEILAEQDPDRFTELVAAVRLQVGAEAKS